MTIDSGSMLVLVLSMFYFVYCMLEHVFSSSTNIEGHLQSVRIVTSYCLVELACLKLNCWTIPADGSSLASGPIGVSQLTTGVWRGVQ